MVAGATLLLKLFFTLLLSSGLSLPTPSDSCDNGFICKSEEQCASFQNLKEILRRLNSAADSRNASTEYHRNLTRQVEERICNQETKMVCCEESLELTNGNIVRSPEDIPFMARLTIKTGYADYAICGASLIDSQHMITAKHCLKTFYDECIDETDCVAFFRDLAIGPTNHEPGQFQIAITEVFEREGLSDLAVVQLKHKVEEHKDYKLGTPLQPIKLATESPQPGEKALTAGWGVTGYNQELSTELRSLELTISTIGDLWLYTHITDERGRITDPCKGDSGGPLAVRRNREWQLVGVLKGEGYNCRDNQTTGDGLWSNVAAQREWILRQLQPQNGNGEGELSLRGWIGKLGGVNDRGNVYVGEFPVQRCEMSNKVAVAFLIFINIRPVQKNLFRKCHSVFFVTF